MFFSSCSLSFHRQGEWTLDLLNPSLDIDYYWLCLFIIRIKDVILSFQLPFCSSVFFSDSFSPSLLSLSSLPFLSHHIKNGGVQEVLHNTLQQTSQAFRTMGLPARKKVASQVFHDNVQNGKARLQLKDVPLSLEVSLLFSHFVTPTS